MKELNADDRGLLDLARDGHEPTDADRGRLRARLVAELGVGTGLVVTATAVSTSAAAAGAAGGSGAGAGFAAGGGVALGGVPATLSVAKMISVVVLSSVVGGGGVATYHAVRAARDREAILAASPTPGTARTRRIRSPDRADQSMVVASLDEAPPPPTVAPPSATGAAPSTRTAAAVATRSETTTSRTAPHNAPGSPRTAIVAARDATVPARDTLVPTRDVSFPAHDTPVATRNAPVPIPISPSVLEFETRMVKAGLSALHAGDAVRALALFDQHERQYPNGIFAEERAAERIVCLCDLGRTAEARAAARTFLRDHGRSLLAARVRASCGVPSYP